MGGTCHRCHQNQVTCLVSQRHLALSTELTPLTTISPFCRPFCRPAPGWCTSLCGTPSSQTQPPMHCVALGLQLTRASQGDPWPCPLSIKGRRQLTFHLGCPRGLVTSECVPGELGTQQALYPQSSASKCKPILHVLESQFSHL